MILSGYQMEIFRPKCNSCFESVHCIARLNEDIGDALPYLNAVLGGTQYFNDPPELMFHHHGRIIKVGSKEIAINALHDESEAKRILSWLMNEINQVWEDRSTITPSYTERKLPKLIDILRMLPKMNCRKCGQPTCLVFAVQMREGGKGADQCPELSKGDREKLSKYMDGFVLE